MPLELVLQQVLDESPLSEKRDALTAARTVLAERESEAAQFRSQLRIFEAEYFRTVGTLYATLDDLEARIAEREVDLYDSDTARRRAEESRQRAQETHDAAFGEAGDVEEFDPPPSLKTLFREVAKRIHPDFARDDAEQKYFTLLMARANQAYSRGDSELLQRLLDDHDEIPAVMQAESSSAELYRLVRQLQHVKRDIAALDVEMEALRTSEIGQMQRDAEAASQEHRDLLGELAASLHEQIAEAQRRFELVDRQISAHGR